MIRRHTLFRTAIISETASFTGRNCLDQRLFVQTTFSEPQFIGQPVQHQALRNTTLDADLADSVPAAGERSHRLARVPDTPSGTRSTPS